MSGLMKRRAERGGGKYLGGRAGAKSVSRKRASCKYDTLGIKSGRECLPPSAYPL